MPSAPSTDPSSDAVPTHIAATLLQLSPGAVRRRLRDGQLAGFKYGHRWRVWLSDGQHEQPSDQPALVQPMRRAVDNWGDTGEPVSEIVAMLRDRLRTLPPEPQPRSRWARLLVWRR